MRSLIDLSGIKNQMMGTHSSLPILVSVLIIISKDIALYSWHAEQQLIYKLNIMLKVTKSTKIPKAWLDTYHTNMDIQDEEHNQYQLTSKI